MATDLKFFTGLAGGSQVTQIADTTATDVYDVATVDRRISNFLISSDDTSDQTATISISDGTTANILGKVTIPDGAGTNGTDAAVDIKASLATIFTELDNAGNKYLDIPTGWKLVVTMGAVTADKKIMVNIIGGAA